MAIDDPTFALTIGEGYSARAIACRRPRREDVDFARLAILVAQVRRYQGRIEALERAPQEGAGEAVADLTVLADDTLRALRRRIAGALERVAPDADRAAVVAWFRESDDGEWATRILAAYLALADALTPPSLPGK